MKTSLVERTPGAGRQENFSSGVASASASNWLETWCHSPSYPCQIPSGGACAYAGRTVNSRNKKSVFLMVYLVLAFSSPWYTVKKKEERFHPARCVGWRRGLEMLVWGLRAWARLLRFGSAAR